MPPSPYRTIIESMFRVVDRRGTACDFRLNEQQAELDAGWSRRNLVTKIRQHAGISTYVIARFVAKCLAEENRRCVIVSAEADATARLLARARYIVNNLKGGLRPSIGTDNTRAMVFTATGSSFWIGTAGQRTFGRGDTITDLHLSEAAFYLHPDDLIDGLFPAAELGEITVESTGNGRGNWFHEEAVAARDGVGFKLFFFSWVGLESCALPVPDEERFLGSLIKELEEDKLYYEEGVSLPQLAWRRERIREYRGNLQRFKENYPRTFDECFQSTNRSFFRDVRFQKADWQQESTNLWVLAGHPVAGYSYVQGADVASGTGKDNSVASIWCLQTREQAAEWASNAVQPHDFGRLLMELGARFNNAYTNVERNNHGLTTLAAMVGQYPLDRLHRGTTTGSAPSQVLLSNLSNYGTHVSETSRGFLLGTAQGLLSSVGGEYTVHSPLLESELSTFVENAAGKLEADSGCKDDRVFAACHALAVVERAAATTIAQPSAAQQAEADPFSWEAIFGDQQTEGGSSLYGLSSRYG